MPHSKSGSVSSSIDPSRAGLSAGFGREIRIVDTLRIGSDYTFKWQVLATFLGPSLVTNLMYDPARLGKPWQDFIPVAAATYGVTVLLFCLAGWLKSRFRPTAGLFYAFFWFALIGALRGLVAFYVTRELGLAPLSDIAFRLTSPAVFAVIVFAISSAVVTTLGLNAKARDNLAKENLLLKQAIGDFKNIHERLRVDLLASVMQVVQPALNDLREKFNAAKLSLDSASIIDALRTTSDDIIRPLSQDVATQTSQLSIPSQPVTSKQKPKLPARKVAVNLVVGWGTVLSVGVQLAPEAVIRKLGPALVVELLLAISFYGVLWVLNIFLKRLRVFPVFAVAITIGAYWAGSMAASSVWAPLPWHLGPSERDSFAATAFIMGLCMGVISSGLSLTRQNLRALQDTNASMVRLLSRLRRQIWLDRRRVATVLHGPVQATLQAVSMRIATLEQPDPQVIERSEREIEAAIEQLSAEPDHSIDFEGVLDEMMAVWEDIVDFKVSLDSRALAAVQASRDAKDTVLEVIREAITNAMKHCSPTEIRIRLESAGHRMISVEVVNDGVSEALAAATEVAKSGYGQMLLTELTHSWSIDVGTEFAVLRAKFVLDEPML